MRTTTLAKLSASPAVNRSTKVFQRKVWLTPEDEVARLVTPECPARPVAGVAGVGANETPPSTECATAIRTGSPSGSTTV